MESHHRIKDIKIERLILEKENSTGKGNKIYSTEKFDSRSERKVK
jgi:hypothetical protein